MRGIHAPSRLPFKNVGPFELGSLRMRFSSDAGPPSKTGSVGRGSLRARLLPDSSAEDVRPGSFVCGVIRTSRKTSGSTDSDERERDLEGLTRRETKRDDEDEELREGKQARKEFANGKESHGEDRGLRTGRAWRGEIGLTDT
ncbi:unnamed protein product [Darwinula stevensoni]|uniref:Uncharacterized protein n=1 Tax=Darwinula stevensoni TaxID=69355 RepID=A0A7R9ACF6_9CRUS|nr:unnamed protein product [Darwinula stevensoni]CAG0899973.1 unnamed protein product [Darwinula stevensoni]